MMQQYMDIKRTIRRVLFFRLGDFYEMSLGASSLQSDGSHFDGKELRPGRKGPMCGVLITPPIHSKAN